MNSSSAFQSPVRSTRSLPGSPFIKTFSRHNHLPSVPPLTLSATASSTSTSLQSSPDGFQYGRAVQHADSPVPLQLPESSLPPSPATAQSVVAEVLQQSKGNGPIRRVSRSAINAPLRLIRRRQSSTSVKDRYRDQSTGPLIMRRQSSSRASQEVDACCDLSLDGSEAALFGEPVPPLLPGNGSVHDRDRHLLSNVTSLRPSPQNANPDPVRPTVDLVLRQGTVLTKVTRKKRKQILFIIDRSAVKVSWNASNPSKRFYVDDIVQIRAKGDARHYREELQVAEEHEPCWFTIIYADPVRSKSGSIKTIHLIAPNVNVLDLWVTSLEAVARYRQRLMKSMASAGPGQWRWILQNLWDCEMLRLHSGHQPPAASEAGLDVVGVESILKSLYMDCSRPSLHSEFERADARKTGRLAFDDFETMFDRLRKRSDVWEIYQRLTAGRAGGRLDLQTFLDFLRHTQGVDISDADPWHKVFADLARASHPAADLDEPELTPQCMDFEAFSLFLCTSHNDILKTGTSRQRLDAPLNQYFISSSHNTYLTGRQVAGNSSTEAYAKALQQGCRCVEIDCWDGPSGLPIVVHGRTLTTSVLFSDCISTIGKYAFIESPYPLILSLEVHCSAAQQQTMVNVMLKEFGDKILLKPLVANASALPSPEDLRFKILIKVKRGADDCALPDMPSGRRKRSASSPFTKTQPLDTAPASSGPPLSSPPTMSPLDISFPAFNHPWSPVIGPATTTSLSSGTDDSDAPVSPRTKPPKVTKSKIIKSLGDLGVYTTGFKYHDFNLPESKAYNHVFSIAEGLFESLCRVPETKRALEKHNTRYLMRVYPSAFRVKSSNFDPVACWRKGVQMVALNWQTYDLGMQLNEAMFASGSDRTGYVLKPKELRPVCPSDAVSDAGMPASTRAQKKLISFSVELISGQRLPRSRGSGTDNVPNPYVEIEMVCAEDKGPVSVTGEGGKESSARNATSGMGAPHRRRSKVIHRNGFNPVFNEAFKLSLETKFPSLVFIRWTVCNAQDGRNPPPNGNNPEVLATFTAKLSDLQTGYRYLQLRDQDGNKVLSTLFCKIVKERPVSVEYDEPIAEKLGRFKQLGQALKRSLSTDKRSGASRRGSKSKESEASGS